MTAIQKGMLLRVKTKTKNDTFGEVMYEVIQTGMPAPEKERLGQMDGLKVVMLGGSGPSAHAGLTLTDSESKINQDIASGITTIVPAAQKASILAQYQKKANAGGKIPHSGTGVVELG